MHRPFVTTKKFENEDSGALRLDYVVAAVDTADAKAFLDLEMDRYTIEKIVRSHHAAGADAQAALCAAGLNGA